jgi:hypothetical protein
MAASIHSVLDLWHRRFNSHIMHQPLGPVHLLVRSMQFVMAYHFPILNLL